MILNLLAAFCTSAVERVVQVVVCFSFWECVSIKDSGVRGVVSAKLSWNVFVCRLHRHGPGPTGLSVIAKLRM